MASGIIGLPDPGIWLAYLLSLASAALCVIYALIRGRMADTEPTPVDKAWANHEKDVREKG
jgi:hypothetical protein